MWCSDNGMRWVMQSSSPTDVLVRWLIEQRGLAPQRADVSCTDDGACTLIANQDTQAGQVRPGMHRRTHACTNLQL